MGHDDRFDDLIASLGGFHRSWLVYLGLELGLIAAVRAAGREGIAPVDLAARTGRGHVVLGGGCSRSRRPGGRSPDDR